MWLGGKSHGYASISREKERGSWLGHLYLYRLLIGEVPEGMTLDHTCHHPDKCAGGTTCPHRACLNLNHLQVVTRGENVLRGAGISAEYARRSECNRGHPLSGANLVFRQGHRRCRTCEKEWAQEARSRNETACKNGHTWQPETTKLDKLGRRYCLICDYRSEPRPNRRKDFCKHGHSLTDPKNVRTTPEGFRDCRTCSREKMRRRRAVG